MMRININDMSALEAAKIIRDYCKCGCCGECIFSDDQNECVLHYHVAAYWFDEEGDLNYGY